ncbi:CheA signal transduction histidine kinase [Thiorhodococcus drewsii AZ1]|uniref:Chemotaxis protein CheA n=1 Tax=Thiorhodococcus drewsii AZ1 TaxID=765913 RepID=G2E7T1_9GAMM|nr:chemotaxis protein CheA [Thiorhodococcus drewsii]EGV27842.1 CheA signal transduction histidine kinase [Thiorhodococcus drewsii AZ1]
MSDPVDIFRTEAEEHLSALESALLELEQRPEDPELIALAFRAMHTIKGGGGMFGFTELSAFTHHLETALDKVRNGLFPVSPELISILLDAKDHIMGLLEDPVLDQTQILVGRGLLERLHALIPDEQITEAKQTTAAQSTAIADPGGEGRDQVYRVRIRPSAGAFRDGFDIFPILKELQGLGTCYITTDTGGVPVLAELDPESCMLSWDLVLVTSQGVEAIRDTFIFVADEWRIDIDPIDIDDDQCDRIGEILVERGLIARSQIETLLAEKPRVGEVLQQAGLVTETDVDAALREQQAIRDTRERSARGEQESLVRVPAARLDSLMNLVGELVIVQARMHQLAQSRDDEAMGAISEDLDRLTTELRDNTFSIRMLPIGTTFGRFRRLVRDLSRELGKEIRLETEGAETELDKMVIDRLGDPLVHLIRNSIDHGIEPPEQREAAGKPAAGTIHLAAEHAESHVVIRIRDDGAGLNTGAIRAKAVERGLIARDQTLTEEEIQSLIFEAGFSTADRVSDISGRGVGMDVVKRSIQDLGGQVGIRSEPGRGTTLTITLPMTLAIIEGLMVAVSEERYVLPLSCVEECIEVERGSEGKRNGQRLARVRGDLVPYLSLREWFAVPGAAPDIEQIVVTRLGEQRFGFSVDQVVGQYQTVVKRLGKLYEGNAGLAGATILGDGGVAMILDAGALAESLEDEVRTRGRKQTGRPPMGTK